MIRWLISWIFFIHFFVCIFFYRFYKVWWYTCFDLLISIFFPFFTNICHFYVYCVLSSFFPLFLWFSFIFLIYSYEPVRCINRSYRLWMYESEKIIVVRCAVIAFFFFLRLISSSLCLVWKKMAINYILNLKLAF